jgi:hypothetical protein
MFDLNNAGNLKETFNNINSEESKKTFQQLKLIVKQSKSKNTDYTLVKYDHDILLHDLRQKTGLLRSTILNNKGKILGFSPPKSMLFDSFKNKYKPSECIAQEYIEGTMINLFYNEEQCDDGDWEFATKSNIGGRFSFCKGEEENKTFREMFLEACNEAHLDFDMLNTDYSYSFVMQHPENHMVSNINEINLYLVRVYKIDNDKLIVHEVERTEYINDLKAKTCLLYPVEMDVDDYDKTISLYASMNTSWNIMGITFVHKKNRIRAKVRNPVYEEVKKLRGNQPKLQYTYLSLRKDGNVGEYLKYYPSSKVQFTIFRDQVHNFTKALHKNYMSCFISKDKPLKEFPYQYRSHMYILHYNHYLNHLREEKGKVTLKYVINYINSLHPSKLMFSLNYNVRKQYLDNKKKLMQDVQNNDE